MRFARGKISVQPPILIVHAATSHVHKYELELKQCMINGMGLYGNLTGSN